MTKEWIKKYYNEVLPYYRNIGSNPELKAINQEKPLSFFCTQWGDLYPTQANDGILFVGRATNGWRGGFDAERLLTDGVFNSPDQMEWVNEIWSYNTVEPSSGQSRSWTGNRSPFWRVIRKVTETFYPEDWYRHIAWSNLCKVSYEESGNPSDNIFFASYEDARAILKSDIKMLSPKVIVMITGFKGWGDLFVEDIVGKTKPQRLSCSSGYAAIFQGNNQNVIIIDRPEHRQEKPFVKAITTAINSLM